jgi:hypothetical protein
MILNQQVNSSEVTAEYLNHFTPGKIGVAGRKYKVNTCTENNLPVNLNTSIIITEL